MAEQDEAILLVNKLNDVHLSANDQAALGETADVLSRLAVSLRQSDIRDALSSTTLPNQLSEILRDASQNLDASLGVIEQTGRAAANLAANCDVARDGLVEAGYIDHCCQVLEQCCEVIDQSITAVKALTVSLLNMVIEGHEKSSEEVFRHCLPLVGVSNILLERLNVDDDGEQILQWIWTILGLVLEDKPNPSLIPHIIRPFVLHSDPSRSPPPLPVLTSAAEILDAWCNAEEVNIDGYTAYIGAILDFVEKAEWRGDEAADEDESKAFAGVKGSLITALIGLSSSIPPAQSDFWTRMDRWLALQQRDDLQCCALLSYGNRAREDSSATALLPEILPSIRHILQPGITDQVLHSVIGLLRNLSIPDANKIILGETGLLDKLVEVGVWSKERDMLGSVQGGSVGIVKNLCRGNVQNAVKVAHHASVIDQISDLSQRTDDPAIRFEATRVFVNCIRSISSDAAERDALSKFEEPIITSALMDMFKDSGPYPVLANESIIALALLVTFGSNETSSTIASGLSGLVDRIVDVLGPKEGEEAASKEVRANLVTLLRQSDARTEAGLLVSVKAALGSTTDGRTISEEGETL